MHKDNDSRIESWDVAEEVEKEVDRLCTQLQDLCLKHDLPNIFVVQVSGEPDAGGVIRGFYLGRNGFVHPAIQLMANLIQYQETPKDV